MGNRKNKKKNKQKELERLKSIERNRRIEESIKKESEKYEQEVKLLLLDLFKTAIQMNLVLHTKILVMGMEKLDLEFETENESLANDFLEVEETICKFGSDELKETIKTLWKDPGLKKAFENRSILQVPDTHSYYLDQIDRITKRKYVPTDQDILYCRIPTTGVKVVDFFVNDVPWKIVDVGGQRSERRKWIHQFDDVTMIIYVVAMSEYDQDLYEDETVNRMRESLELFKSTANNEYFEKTACSILFNKFDIFGQKIKNGISLSKCFDDFEEKFDVEVAKEFITNKFTSCATNEHRKVYNYYSCGIDTENIKAVFTFFFAMPSQEFLVKYSKSVIVKNVRCMQVFKFDRFRELLDKRGIKEEIDLIERAEDLVCLCKI
ncbi:guanine nucleotide-binding protein g(o) subunit alpha [Anaeramoeba flamelloides]|uniref:Guanine nucleotide-binding protein g(O) subunit alpha n=1 Tax=Anaeramoeba flamelloides TaxID=1746091 RepID=A0AAV7YFE4_9EUKA|nr:guanine nucleotide-binding protein g(o) subunit alpha [Anaeramoeba flamelloides]